MLIDVGTSPTTPRSPPPIIIAVVPRMRPDRDSRAWETRKSVLGTTKRMASLRGKESRPSLAMPNALGNGYHRQTVGGIKIFSCEPEPPEARVRTPRAKDAKSPEARAGSLGEISEEGGTPTPLTAFTRSQRQVLRFHLSGNGLNFAFFAGPKPPEACSRTLGEGCERGGVPLPTGTGPGRDAASLWMHILLILASPRPPEACTRTLGEGCARGGAPLAPLTACLRGVGEVAGQRPSSRGALCSSRNEGAAKPGDVIGKGKGDVYEDDAMS
ncbi:hypothetical protein FB107DRAFT_291839 [Schizophyllum commune]